MNSKPPRVLLFESGASNEVLVFRSTQSAESYVEPIDVDENVYIGFLETGERLNLSVERKRGLFRSRRDVSIKLAQFPRKSETTLSDVVNEWWSSYERRGGDSTKADRDLKTLIDLVGIIR